MAAVKLSLQPVLLLLTGAGLLRISFFSDLALRYVKAGLLPFLVASGIVLLIAGTIGVLRPGLRAGSGHGHEHTHDHDHGPRIAWLLLLSALVVLLFPPPALGSYSASRDNPVVVAPFDHFRPFPATGAVPLSLTEFIARAQQDEEGSIEGRSVVLQGFVTPREDGIWDLTRLVVSCCAADSRPLTVTVHGARAPRADSWVRVTGTWRPGGTLGTLAADLALNATEVTPVPEPANPYLDRPPAPR
ncbi:TIGR03943 family putative permease subunit [Streptomyces sp. NPDC058657]|uniref:TIGR03943 family putative permease subunit n=1 Tax=unclassified Streptomyces TaxID=2593676 RepID=UPI00364CD542